MVDWKEWGTGKKWGTEHIRRHQVWEDYLHSNSGTLLTFATEHFATGEDSGDTEFVLSEAYSRTQMIKAIRVASGSVTVDLPHIHSHYDGIVNDTKLECKGRLNDEDQYLTDDVSFSKKEYLEIEGDDNVLVVVPHWEGITRSYWLKDGKDGGWWEKDKTTVKKDDYENEEKVLEKRIKFNPEDAVWTVKIELPIQ